MTIPSIQDAQGNLRRCGSLPKPAGLVCNLPPYAAEPNNPLWNDETIKEVVTDSSRVKSRSIFDSKWILDQLSYGSCNGHSLAGSGARARYKRGKRDGLLFSGAYSYSKMNGHRDNGSLILDDIEVSKKGFCPLDLVPANMIYPEQQPANADVEATKYKGLKAYRLLSLRALRTALAAGFPCIVAVMAGNNFNKLNNKGICGLDSGIGNHAVLVDDLEFKNGIWLYDMANSWGTNFGQDGRGYLTENHLLQTFGPHEFVCVPSFDDTSEE